MGFLLEVAVSLELKSVNWVKFNKEAFTGSSKVRLTVSLLKSSTKQFRSGAAQSASTLKAGKGVCFTATMLLMSEATTANGRTRVSYRTLGKGDFPHLTSVPPKNQRRWVLPGESPIPAVSLTEFRSAGVSVSVTSGLLVIVKLPPVTGILISLPSIAVVL